jgi:hypothetical protein
LFAFIKSIRFEFLRIFAGLELAVLYFCFRAAQTGFGYSIKFENRLGPTRQRPLRPLARAHSMPGQTPGAAVRHFAELGATPPGFEGELPTAPVPPFLFARHRALLPRSSAPVRKLPPKDSAGEPPICRAPTRVRGPQHLPHLLFLVAQEPAARSLPTAASSSPFLPPKHPTGDLTRAPHSCGFCGKSTPPHQLLPLVQGNDSEALVLAEKPSSAASPTLPPVRSSTPHPIFLLSPARAPPYRAHAPPPV